VITVRPARTGDAATIAAVHVAAWRSAYPGILPDDYLARLSVRRQTAHYDATIRAGVGVHVAVASGQDLGPAAGLPRIIGFATAGRARGAMALQLAEGEVETLYLLDDWRERGIGRRLMQAAAGHLAGLGCASALVWVLRDNPSRWFYAHLGGKPAAEMPVEVGGVSVTQTAYVWSPIDRLVQASSAAS
jgi:GNAT superfamily N-acetyltransferase